GDIKQRNFIPKLTEDEKQGGHARRVMLSYENWFAESNKAELDVLYLLGLFDRPAVKEAIDVLKKKPAIKGLTDRLQHLSNRDWQQTLNHLRELHLIAEKDKHNPDTIDCHPLIREHFGEKLEKQNPNGWKQAHVRLYEYYKNLPEKELPDTLEEMEPLFATVMHGCLAGKHQEALIDVYWNRICRQNEFYSTNKLGAFGANLSCLSAFFETLWDKPASGLKEDLKATTLSWAGFHLRAVGRLAEAAQPMKTGLEAFFKDKDWIGAAINTYNLSELYLTLGDLAVAEKYGAQGLTFADRSGDEWQKIGRRTNFGEVLHQLGDFAKSKTFFNDAESIINKAGYTYLFAIWGFRFNNLLLDNGKYGEVIKRTKITKQHAISSGHLIDVPFENLSFGKALILRSIDNHSSDFTEAEDYLNQAVYGLREAGQQITLPSGLLGRAILFRHQKDFLKSWTDLDEAREIAEYGQMRLHLTDYNLEVCRNIKAQLAVAKNSLSVFEIIENGEIFQLTKEEMQAKFLEHFKEAKRLINETGYHRRDGELEELKDNK
ncbi:tetratricopeptide repeat protein, partial [bacterium]|nr:tetratricopeptide repeat protein [bacterium]